MSPRRTNLSRNQKITISLSIIAIMVMIVTAFIAGHDWFSNTTPLSEVNTATLFVTLTPTIISTPNSVNTTVSVFTYEYPFRSTGVAIHAGDRVQITTSDVWSCGRETGNISPEGYLGEYDPNTVFPGGPICALIGAISSTVPPEDFDQYILLGNQEVWVAKENGELYLGINDTKDGFSNNPLDSKLEVDIIVIH